MDRLRPERQSHLHSIHNHDVLIGDQNFMIPKAMLFIYSHNLSGDRWCLGVWIFVFVFVITDQMD